MPFSGSTLYPTVAAGVGTNKALKDTAPAADSTTVCSWTASEAQSWKQAKPGATNTTAATPTAGQNNGWNILAADLDATASLPANRSIPAGTWTVPVSISLTVVDAVNAVYGVQAFLHKRSAAGALTQIGNASSAQAVFLTNPTTFTATMTGVAAQLLAPGESIQLELWIHGTGPAVTGTAANINIGSTTTVTDPGLFNSFPRSSSATANATATRQPFTIGKRLTATATTAGTLGPRTIATAKTTTVTVAAGLRKLVTPIPKLSTVTTSAANTKSVAPIPKTTTVTTAAALRKLVTPIPKVATVTASAALARTITAARAFGATVTATSGFARALIAARAFVTTVTASSAPRLDIPMSALNRIISGAPDYPITTPTKAIAGITRNAAGAALGSCTVRLVRQSDNVTVASATSNASTGAYSFVRDAADPNVYFVIAFLTGAPEVHGVTDRGLVPA